MLSDQQAVFAVLKLAFLLLFPLLLCVYANTQIAKDITSAKSFRICLDIIDTKESLQILYFNMVPYQFYEILKSELSAILQKHKGLKVNTRYNPFFITIIVISFDIIE